MTRTRDHWTDDAACVGYDVDLFRDEQPVLAAAATIRRFCHHCPVTEQCLRAADATKSVGVWGAHYIVGWPKRYKRAADDLDGRHRPRQTQPAAEAPPPPRPVTASSRRGHCRACEVLCDLDDGQVAAHQAKTGRPCWGAGYPPEEHAS